MHSEYFIAILHDYAEGDSEIGLHSCSFQTILTGNSKLDEESEANGDKNNFY